MRRPAVFLDRDGTIIEDVDFLRTADQLRIFPWSAPAIRALNEAGHAVVVVTNQSGIARGLFDEAQLGDVHAALTGALAGQGAAIDAYYFCPHHPDALDEQYRLDCACRKPAPGLVLRARDDMGLDLSRSWMVGDRWRDVEAGLAAGVRSILVRTGYGAEDAAHPPADVRADAILDNLMEAVDWILRSSR